MAIPGCQFPACDEPAGGDDGVYELCPAHRDLLISDPGEFRRQWGALEPRAEQSRTYVPRRLDGAGGGR